MSEGATRGGAGEVFQAFLLQGLTAFGGPFAHVGHFRREFVERRGWLTEADYADLLGLAQLLPGSASSQLGMAIGLRRAGYAGLVAAWLGFMLPAGAAMIALAYLAPALHTAWGRGVGHGLKLAVAAIVLQAVAIMARRLAIGPIRAGMALGAAFGLVMAPGPVAQVFALAAGALIGLALLREPETEASPAVPGPGRPPPIVLAALGALVVLLGLLPLLAAWTQHPLVGVASVFYRAGALAFGGGHVILPLLENEVVARGWLAQDTFLAGYGAMQALPGPLFAFAGFAGSAVGGWPAGVVALLAIFLPGLLLTVGLLPVWDQVRAAPAGRAALAGLNAVVVGVVAAALWDPVLKATVREPGDWALVAAAYVFLAVARLPPWLVVSGFAVAAGFFLR